MKLLYSNGSPFARKVRIALFEKGLNFEADVHDAVRPIEQIRPHNPALQVPVLYDGDRHLFGSNLIVEYLFETYPGRDPSNPNPPFAPTITRKDRHWDDKLILTTIETMANSIVAVRLLAGADEERVPFLARQKTRIATCLDWLEERITDDGFWPGTCSVLDINLMCPLIYTEKRGIFDYRNRRWPKIVAMVDRLQSRPSVAATPISPWRPEQSQPLR
jgi:glutathione S-transferase